MKPSILHATSLMVGLLSDLLQQALKINGQHELRAWRQGHENAPANRRAVTTDQFRLIFPLPVIAESLPSGSAVVGSLLLF